VQPDAQPDDLSSCTSQQVSDRDRVIGTTGFTQGDYTSHLFANTRPATERGYIAFMPAIDEPRIPHPPQTLPPRPGAPPRRPHPGSRADSGPRRPRPGHPRPVRPHPCIGRHLPPRPVQRHARKPPYRTCLLDHVRPVHRRARPRPRPSRGRIRPQPNSVRRQPAADPQPAQRTPGLDARPASRKRHQAYRGPDVQAHLGCATSAACDATARLSRNQGSCLAWTRSLAGLPALAAGEHAQASAQQPRWPSGKEAAARWR
jgi:hypothetical protein